MKPSEYIRKGWCQGTSALDHSGTPCVPTSPAAVAWCIYGAIYAAYPEDIRKRESICQAIRNRVGQPTLPDWNDAMGRTQQEAVDLLESIGY